MKRVALVTGAASGLGAAVAKRLRAAGYRVGGLDVSPEIDADLALVADVTQEDQVQAAVSKVSSEFGPLHAVACCAGIATRDWLLSHQQPWAEWTRMLDVNLTGTYRVLRTALPQLSEVGGAIVLTASVAATQPLAGGTPYSVSKAGVLALMRGLALEYAHRNVRVNAVSPGFMDTPMASRNLSNAAFRKSVESSIPLGRISAAEDVAAVIDFLLSDAARDITGREIVVDAGRSLTTYAIPEVTARLWERQ